MYAARHYVRVNGKMFTPGEIITEKIDEDKAARLVRLSAISMMADEARTDMEPVKRGPAPEDTSVTDTPGMPDGEECSGKPVEADVSEDEEEAEAPEIDVTDGIVADAEEAPAAAPRKRTVKKK